MGTTNYNFNKPVYGTRNWDIPINENWDDIDTLIKTNSDEIGILSNLNTTDKTSIVNAVNSHLADYAKQVNKVFNVQGYGAKGDGITIDTTAINSAISDLNSAGGGMLFFPKGTYIVDMALTTITVTAQILGAGAKIQTSVNGINVFTINSYFTRISDLEIAYTGTTPTSGSGILLQDLDHSNIENCNINGFYINIDTLNASYWTIFNNLLYDPIKYNIRVQNTTSPDEGDSLIIGNKLFASNTNNIDAHIHQESSGGLKIQNNKFLYGKLGIEASIIDGVVTSILLINANSIEHQSESFIKLKRLNTTGLIEFVTITGNEMRSDVITTGVLLDDGIETSTITGNVIIGQSTGTAIKVNNTAKDATIVSNTFKTWNTGILLNYNNSNSNRVTIDANQYADNITYIFKNTGYIQDNSIECKHDYSNNVVASDNINYINIYQIDLQTYSGGILDLDVYGIISGAGSFSRHISKLINREGVGITLTAISDVASGIAIDVNFDVATISGSVIVQIRKGSTTGTNLSGTTSISVRGDVIGLKSFNTI